MNKREVGMNIKKARKNKGLKQKELANLIGFSESSISKYEQGLITIPPGVLEKIAKVLDVPLVEIYDWDEEFNPNGILAKEVRIYEEISEVFGKDTEKLISDYNLLNSEGKTKACDYVSDLTINPKYKKKEPSSAATDNDSEG
ncbi:helix-turn-helix transcriptional regulator [bacterium]|nr:helix-turn-helix transcriptional regulator [bacterium]